MSEVTKTWGAMGDKYPIPGLTNQDGTTASNSRGPLAALYTNEQGSQYAAAAGSSIFFPHDISGIDHWITFRAFKTDRAIRRREDREAEQLKVPLSFITLPMPAGLSTGYDVNYGSQDLGILGMSLLDNVPNSFDDAGDLISSIASAISDIEGIKSKDWRRILGINLSRAAVTTAGAAIAGRLNSPTGRAVGGQLGVARNPHNAVLFSDVSFRSHSFSYRFSPVSRQEAETLRTIINLFKWYMSPGYAGTTRLGTDLTSNLVSVGMSPEQIKNYFFSYPEYFEIDFHHPQFLFNIGPSVLKSFNVNYHPNNTPSYARPFGAEGADASPAPTEISLDFQFQEVEIVNKDTIQNHNR